MLKLKDQARNTELSFHKEKNKKVLGNIKFKNIMTIGPQIR